MAKKYREVIQLNCGQDSMAEQSIGETYLKDVIAVWRQKQPG